MGAVCRVCSSEGSRRRPAGLGHGGASCTSKPASPRPACCSRSRRNGSSIRSPRSPAAAQSRMAAPRRRDRAVLVLLAYHAPTPAAMYAGADLNALARSNAVDDIQAMTQWTTPQTDELRRLVKAGYSFAEIGRRFGMTPGAVREKGRRIGMRRTRHRTKSLTQDEALAELELVAKVTRQRKD